MTKLFPILLAIILLVGCASEPPVQVSTQTVQPTDGNLTLTHDGKIALSDALEIRSAVSGRIVEKFFEDGSDVTAGQPLFKIGDPNAHNELVQLKAELAKAKIDSAKALANNDDSTAQLQFDVEDKSALLETLEAQAEDGMIYAPKSGSLGLIDTPLGMPVTADDTLLAIVGNVDPAVVTFEVSPTEARLISDVENLKVTLKFPDGMTYPLEGALELREGFTAEAFFDNPDEILLRGTAAQIHIDGLKLENALLVPEVAIQHRDDEIFVYVDVNGKAAVKKISLGDKLGTHYIITDGLNAGDSIIVEGFDTLRDGSPLEIN